MREPRRARPEETDTALAATIHGAARLLLESGKEFDSVEDMIPVKPLADVAPAWRQVYLERLGALYRKLKPHTRAAVDCDDLHRR